MSKYMTPLGMMQIIYSVINLNKSYGLRIRRLISMRHELINRNNLILVSIYFIAFVIIYGSSLVKNGYHFDEIADFTNNMMIQSVPLSLKDMVIKS